MTLGPMNDHETADAIGAMNPELSPWAGLIIELLRRNGWLSPADQEAKDAEIEGLRARAEQAERERDRLTAEMQDAYRSVDRQVRRGDRLTDQTSTIRTLQAMYDLLRTRGMPGERDIFGRVADDLGKVLDPPAPAQTTADSRGEGQ